MGDYGKYRIPKDLDSALARCLQGRCIAYPGMNPGNRAKVHDYVRTRHPGKFITFTRDAGTIKVLNIVPWRGVCMEALRALDRLPAALRKNILSMACPRLQPEPERHYHYRPPRDLYCGECGVSESDDVDILMSVHFPGAYYCDACIQADVELDGHKWELPYRR